MNQEEPTVVALVTRARDGDQDAWDKIVRRYARLIWVICHEHGLDQDDTNNVAEAVWQGLLRRLYDLPEPMLPQWIARFTKEVCLRVLSGDAEQPAGQAVSNMWARMGADITGFSVRGLTGLAAFLAGREGAALRDEWRAHLAGESGHDPVTWAKIREAAGFVVAGLRDRGQDLADAAWRPVDAVLRSRFLSGLFVVLPTIVDAATVLQYRGPVQVLISFSSIFGAGVALGLAVKTGRKYRDVQPPGRKPRRAGTGGSDGPENG